MLPETKPILFNCPKEFDAVEIYPVHDLHYGSEQFNLRKWNAFLSYGGYALRKMLLPSSAQDPEQPQTVLLGGTRYGRFIKTVW